MHLSAAARPTFYAAHRVPHLRHAHEIHAVRMRLVQLWSGLEKPSPRETHLDFFRFWDRNGACTAAEGHRNDRYITVTSPSACRRRGKVAENKPFASKSMMFAGSLRIWVPGAGIDTEIVG